VDRIQLTQNRDQSCHKYDENIYDSKKRKKSLKYLALAGPCIIIQFKQINQPDATVLQLYYLTFCVAQYVSGASTPIIRSLRLH